MSYKQLESIQNAKAKRRLAIEQNNQLEANYGYVINRLKVIEDRLALLEIEVSNTKRICKTCDTTIDTMNTSVKGLLAELCDKCWTLANADCP